MRSLESESDVVYLDSLGLFSWIRITTVFTGSPWVASCGAWLSKSVSNYQRAMFCRAIFLAVTNCSIEGIAGISWLSCLTKAYNWCLLPVMDIYWSAVHQQKPLICSRDRSFPVNHTCTATGTGNACSRAVQQWCREGNGGQWQRGEFLLFAQITASPTLKVWTSFLLYRSFIRLAFVQ